MQQRHTPNRRKGFQRTSALVEHRLKGAIETRGFAVTRLLTHWADIVGLSTADICTPVKVTYAKGGFGATLTVLTKGAHAQMLQMQLPQIRDKVNACYGYNAISRIKITQTAPVGFTEGQAQFKHAPKADRGTPKPEVQGKAAALTTDIQDETLRALLSDFGANVMTGKKGQTQ